ncbi:hypothetical protein LOTGIDRAFT_103326 [Lottia gigantea]|uniref:G-protein coupled receptors family 1 profile domain-containing protein n=1 Tax=Lottia gigantea TaxID=225164 RepID=V4B4I3_LOTGI|nr:hypothetical protein LOTGIDRAFT_103326 [Lottia gigantea]ESP05383.1 hypothetical protein LOTGIDRAFT_103326 [Lottia gigantea]
MTIDNRTLYNTSADQRNITAYSSPDFIHPFSYLHIKIIFIILYGVVFTGCFIGNIGIILLIIKNKALRTRTNFFLANLAVADFCVGIFCVLPNLSTFLSPAWVLGKVMCKLYYFVQGMSYTASILLLTVIAIERYIAIMHPLRSRHLFTFVRLQIAQVCIWLLACCYNIPHLLVFDTVDIITSKGEQMSFCFVNLSDKDMRTLSTVNFVLWYIIPLVSMIIMYTRISITLWRTSHSQSEIRPTFVLYQKNRNVKGSQMKKLLCVKVHEPTDGDDNYKHNMKFDMSNRDTSSSGSGLTARRKVIRLLMILLITFAFCVLPNHLRVLLHYWHIDPPQSAGIGLLPPVSYLLLYLNSALNPGLYWVFSESFRRSLRETFTCRRRKRR